VRRPLRVRTGAGALGGPLVHLDETGSTNDRARELALAGAPHGTVIVAEHQRAGRGRQGRKWSAPSGRTLTLSVVVRPRKEGMELLPLAVAIAVCEACEAVAPVSCAIKWPNDVWIAERKVAGILIEARPQDGWAVVGIGLNVDTAADELEPELRGTATSLRIATGGPVDRVAGLDAVVDRLAQWIDALRHPEQVSAGFRERDALYGRQVAWTQGGRRMSGAARGIDNDGSLIVFTGGSEPVRLDAGEVHLERP
jgi:BirA family transcriptional regulator, biotin operon repressor / biotin---[acetyl-CoA-carboxylase] ligase